MIQQGFSRVRPDVGRTAKNAPREIKLIRHFTRLAYRTARSTWVEPTGAAQTLLRVAERHPEALRDLKIA
ncbi:MULTISPECIES: hypothetical protein [Paraburkholderia]|uniref:hypothetical protein n=1 Tax=Paraburkholderia TaxID=1822464 RepID=UPI001D131285|nr:MULTISPECIES: hypothetical protein [Paraburkholderia]